jgi:abequosyltransferase
MSIDPAATARPRLTIGIPTYNFGVFIGATLDSITSQLTDGVEVVILDGGSTDDTAAVVRSFQERFPAVRYERREVRGGIDRDLAETVALARGEYCWLFCSDDVMKPGAVAHVLEEIGSKRDIYLCGFCLCTLDMEPVMEHPIVALRHDTDFELGDPVDRLRYFELAQTTTAFFSFAGSIIVSKARWDSRALDEAFVGSCWAHVARLFSIIPEGLSLRYLASPLLDKRSGNDSFMDRGLIRRLALAIDGYNRLADTFFGESSAEARHIRRVVTNEFPSWILLHAKALASREYADDLPLLDRLAATIYAERTLTNVINHLAYRWTPIAVYERARAAYRLVKRTIEPLRRRRALQAGTP